MAGKDDKVLADQLRELIKDSDHSAYSLGKLAGVAEEVIRRFVNGTRGLTLDTAGRLCDALGVLPLAVAKRRTR